MTDGYFFGRIIIMTVYLVEGIAAAVFAFITGSVPPEAAVIGIAVWLLVLFVLKKLSSKKKILPLYFPYVFSFFAIAGGSAAVLAFRNIYINVLFFAILTVGLVFFQRRKLNLISAFIEAAGIGIYYIFPSTREFMPEISMIPVIALCIILIEWIEFNIIRVDIADRKNEVEAERSMDDMLRVIELKCDEARNSTKSKVAFISNISREIRTPINNIMGLNEIIERETENAKIREYSQNISGSLNELMSLVNDILDFTRIENGRIKKSLGRFELSTLIGQIFSENSQSAVDKKVKFNVDVNPEMGEFLYGDDVRIRQVISNIVSCIINYMDNGQLDVYFDYMNMSGRDIKIITKITVNGRGILYDDIRKLFYGFDMTLVTKDSPYLGNAIGLAITKKIIDLLDGSLDIDTVYQSTVLTIVFPVVSLQDEKIGDYRDRLEREGQQKGKYRQSFISPSSRVLFVDDNMMNLKISKLLLKDTQITVDTVSSGAEAIEIIKENRYDVIFLDHMMPGLNGIDTLEKMRQDIYLKDTPVVALTANVISGARDMYADYGFSDYLAKPFTPKLLEKMLIKWLPKNKVSLLS